MLGIYLSGTGNTKHCVEKLTNLLEEKTLSIPIEDERAVTLLKETDCVVLGYPTQFSNAPVMVRDFIQTNAQVWRGKQVICLTTMGAFSGDGTGCTARILRKYGARVVGGLQIRMPNSICDTKREQPSYTEREKIIELADQKIEAAVIAIKQGQYPKEGLSVIHHIAGLLGQRLWFYNKTRQYSDEIKINDSCNGCGLCEQICPMQNLKIRDRKAISNRSCTMCYRCISQCPQKAITLLGTKVKEQVCFEKAR